MFAGWLGIDLGGNFMEESQLRRLLREAPFLLKAKGTRTALQRLIAIFVDEPVFIVEKNLLPASRTKEEEQQRRMLYGDSPYAFIILIRRKADEKLRSRLLFMINQFKPVRASTSIVFLDEGGSMDYYSYMDVNSTITENTEGYMDDSDAAMTGRLYLL